MRTAKKRSQLQERAVARDLSAKTIIASGALWNAKGDVRNEKFLIECKTTEKDFYSVTSAIWNKIEEEAIRDGMRTPLLVVDLRDLDRYVIFSPKSFNHQVKSYELAVYRNESKSYRLKGYSEAELPISFIIEQPSPKGVKRFSLMAMRIEDFMEEFKEEI